MKTAILVDGAFFIKRHKLLTAEDKHTPRAIARSVVFNAWELIKKANPHNYKSRQLYRILFYDCAPERYFAGRHPISGDPYRIEEHTDYSFRAELHSELVKLRKVALRLGKLSLKNGQWAMTKDGLDQLKRGIPFSDIDPLQMYYSFKQSGVDMRIGLDIASLSSDGIIDQIILIAGDSDFVPAAKMARRNGVDFLLDPMWQHVQPELLEHIDGLCTMYPRPKRK